MNTVVALFVAYVFCLAVHFSAKSACVVQKKTECVEGTIGYQIVCLVTIIACLVLWPLAWFKFGALQ